MLTKKTTPIQRKKKTTEGRSIKSFLYSRNIAKHVEGVIMIVLIIESSKDHHWTLKPLSKKTVGEENVYMVLRRHPTNYLCIARRKIHFYSGGIWHAHPYLHDQL